MHSPRNTHPAFSRRRAFTLIELLIAIALMLILTLVLTQIFNSTVDIFSRAEKQVQIYSSQKSFVELLTREFNNLLPASSSSSIENSMRIYSPTEQTSGSWEDDFPHATGSVCRYDRSYYSYDPNYTDGFDFSEERYGDELDLSGELCPEEPEDRPSGEDESGETAWSAPLLGFATNTTYVTGGERFFAPAWVEYFLARAKVVLQGQDFTYYYLKRRVMRPQAAMVGDAQWVALNHSKLQVEPAIQLPYVERPWREELYDGSYEGEVVLEFLPRLGQESEDFEDLGDAFKIEFYMFDPLAEDGGGGFAWVRPDESFGEAVFMPSKENPLNDQSAADPSRPSRNLDSSGRTANIYPGTLLSQSQAGGSTAVYRLDTPLAIRITALLGHDRTTSFEGDTGDVRRQDYDIEDVPPRTFQHVFWLPAAPASAEREPL